MVFRILASCSGLSKWPYLRAKMKQEWWEGGEVCGFVRYLEELTLTVRTVQVYTVYVTQSEFTF